jgi:hypothetical protein
LYRFIDFKPVSLTSANVQSSSNLFSKNEHWLRKAQLSAAGKKRIAAAQRARWAKVKARQKKAA